jgi:hypothetical protein
VICQVNFGKLLEMLLEQHPRAIIAKERGWNCAPGNYFARFRYFMEHVAFAPLNPSGKFISGQWHKTRY